MDQQFIVPLDLGPDQPSEQPAQISIQGSGPNLLMLHGFLGDRTCWQSLAEHLSPNFRCIGLDLLGFGASGKPQITYDVPKEVAFVEAVRVALGLEQLYIVGHSFGGWVGAAYAIAYPGRLLGLILAAPAGIRDDSFCGRYDYLRPLLTGGFWIDWGLILLGPIAQVLRKSADLKTLRWFRQEIQKQPAAKSFLLGRLRPEDAIDTVENQIHRIIAPTLVVIGDQDDTIPLWHAQVYADRIPKAQLTIWPNCDHSLPQAAIPQMHEAISYFIDIIEKN